MATIQLQFDQGDDIRQSTAQIVIGDHIVSAGNIHCLSALCVNADDIKESAEHLKAELDEVVKKATEQFFAEKVRLHSQSISK
jgi:hypothetical protein